ncbi:MAG: cysteine synthase family protein [Parcubacteria group bacterium]|jgi:cysteine synthase B
MIYKNIVGLIGHTPMVKINHVIKKDGVEIFAKLEGQNPSGSIKDRIALAMIEQGEREGKLTKEKIIIEATSGNTGIALAMIGAIKGYGVHVVMSSAVSIERQKLIKAYGAKVILTDGTKGTDGAIMHVRALVKKFPEKYFNPDQFSNAYNKLAHYRTTAEEMWKQMDGRIDYMVSALGTSGTIMGIGKGLKDHDAHIKVVEAHPVKGHYIQGLKNLEEALVPAIYDATMIDERVMVESEDAFDMARKVMLHEGISVGMSSGAALVAAREIAQKIDRGRIVIIFPDRAEKYVSTTLFAG